MAAITNYYFHTFFLSCIVQICPQSPNVTFTLSSSPTSFKNLTSHQLLILHILHIPYRLELSEALETKTYWGSRQQLLAGKVIADWVDCKNGPLDPIFGVLLQPTAGTFSLYSTADFPSQ